MDESLVDNAYIDFKEMKSQSLTEHFAIEILENSNYVLTILSATLGISGIFLGSEIGLEEKSIYFNWIIGISFGLFAGIIIVGYYGSHFRKSLVKYTELLEDNNKKLRQELEEAEQLFFSKYYEEDLVHIEEQLKDIGDKLNFGKCSSGNHSSERITLYCHDEENDCFIPIARHSDNPQYIKLGRPKYPDNIGQIGIAWEKQIAYKVYNTNPETNLDKYISELENEGFSKEDTKSLTMYPRTIFGYRFDHKNGKPVGLYIIESTGKSRYTQEKLISIFENLNIHFSYICKKMDDFLEMHKSYIEYEFEKRNEKSSDKTINETDDSKNIETQAICEVSY